MVEDSIMNVEESFIVKKIIFLKIRILNFYIKNRI